MGDQLSLTDRLEAFFRQRPFVWVDGKQLAQVAGAYAWRSRCADLRKRGLTIENQQITFKDNATNRRWKISEYRYVP